MDLVIFNMRTQVQAYFANPSIGTTHLNFPSDCVKTHVHISSKMLECNGFKCSFFLSSSSREYSFLFIFKINRLT